ncbi:uncharacterized protein LOC131682996 [Topomyia yanbarensis]|uniref:uncharacterized protein LOC131682996 n=1 Tax=Topomyia yanbarensis TaxID=2498891 RepID=UPI00273C6539|nr:uncharacterized protein LOC131682996 [Topomyia yanbarensis]
MKCFVFSCRIDFHGYKTVDSTLTKITKHRFPSSLQRQLAWLQAIFNAEGREIEHEAINFKVVRICSRHFLKDDFYYKNGRKLLYKTAVPSVFGGFPNSSCREVNSSQLRDSGVDEANETQPSISSDIREAAPKIRRRTIRYAGDVKDGLTPDEALVALPKLKAQLSQSQKKLKLLRGKNKRLLDRMSSMQDIIKTLQAEKKVSDATSKGISQDCTSNHSLLEELKSRTETQPCSDAVRSFATTLHIYSPKAYKYVRSVFNNTLPHPRTIIRWHEHTNGEPGNAQESLDAQELKTAEEIISNEFLVMEEIVTPILE